MGVAMIFEERRSFWGGRAPLELRYEQAAQAVIS